MRTLHNFTEYEDHEEIDKLEADVKTKLDALKASPDAPLGCATCLHAERRFNNGYGATTCELLFHRIVTHGHTTSETRPTTCPLGDLPKEKL